MKSLLCVAAIIAPMMCAHAAMSSVDAQSNIYAAGEASPASIGSDGVLPVSIALAADAAIVRFGSVAAGPPVDGSPTGGATCVFNGPASSGDGNTCVSSFTNITAANGYSSFIYDGKSMMLVGLFVPAVKSATTPAGLSYVDATANATTAFSPQLQQVFFIGDGRTTGDVLQTFVVPTGAQTLYLGFADSFGFNGFPGAYSDNFGGLIVDYSISAVPELSTLATVLTGLCLLGAAASRRRHPSGHEM